MKTYKFTTAICATLCVSTAVLANPLEQARSKDYCAADPLTEAEVSSLTVQAKDRLGESAVNRAAGALQVAGNAIAQAQKSEKSCHKAFKRGRGDFDKQLKKKTRKVSRNAGAADSDDPVIREVQQQVRDAFIADQAARLTYIELATTDLGGEDYWAQRLATAHAIELDAVNTQLLKTLLKQYDWIDGQRFGSRIASHAWILAQHADADPEFQKLALSRMEPYLATDGARQRDYAYLFDRVAVNTGGPQRYGTQPESECNDNGTLSPRLLEDPEGVDERRAALGMETMAEAMGEMAAERCRVD